MSTDSFSDEEISKIFSMKNVAVVGISRHPNKAAYYVPAYLKFKHYNIIPVNPSADTIFGVKSYKSLSEVKEPVDIVEIFRPSQDVPPIVDQAIKKGANVVWMQEGISNQEAIGKAQEHGLKVVWNRCMMKEHKRLFNE